MKTGPLCETRNYRARRRARARGRFCLYVRSVVCARVKTNERRTAADDPVGLSIGKRLCGLQVDHQLKPHGPDGVAITSPATSRVKRAARVSEALRGPPSTKQYVGAYAGRCRFRKVRARLMVRAFSSGGSFQGNTVISAFGASEAMSIETWSGCAVTSSGSTSIGVWHDFAKSRDTLYTKSGRTR